LAFQTILFSPGQYFHWRYAAKSNDIALAQPAALWRHAPGLTVCESVTDCIPIPSGTFWKCGNDQRRKWLQRDRPAILDFGGTYPQKFFILNNRDLLSFQSDYAFGSH